MKSLLANILIAIDLISCKLGRNLILVLLLAVGFVLSGMTLICVNISEYDQIEYKKQCDITRTGCMSNENEGVFEPDTSQEDSEKTKKILLSQQPYQQFYNKLKQSDLVEKCAQYSILGNTSVDQEIVTIQEGHQINAYANDDSVEYIQAQKDIFDIYHIKIKPKVKQEKWCTDGVFLGIKFKEKYGDKEYVNFKKKKCKLLGFLQNRIF